MIEFYQKLRMGGDTIDSSLCLNSLLEACLKCDDIVKAIEIFETHKDEVTSEGKQLIDLITFSTLIKGFCKSGKLTEAFSFLDMMKTKEILPDEVLFNSLLDGCSKNNMLEKAFELFDEMESKGVIASTITYNTLIDACVRQN